MSEALEQSDLREGYDEVDFGPKTLIIPSDWNTERFGDVFHRRRESIDEIEDETVKYVGLKHLDSGQLDINGYDEDGRERSSSRVFRKGDVLFGKLRPNLNKAAIAPFSGVCSSDIIPIYAEEDARQQYLPYLMHSKLVRDRVVSTMEGTNLPRTSWSDLQKTKIPLPPPPEQRRIADILSTVDEKIQLTEKAIEDAYSLREALIQDFFSRGLSDCKTKELRLGANKKEVPKHWKVRSLDDVSTVKRGASPRPISDERYFGGDIGWVRISDITHSDKHLKQTSDYLSDEGVSESVLVQKGTILLSISATIGKPAILQTDACIHDGIVAFKDLSGSVNPEYLYYALLEMKERLKSQNQRAAGHQTNINSTVVKRSKILLPPIEEQKTIKDVLGKVDEKIGHEKKEKKSLMSLKRGLMQDLLTGKVRVNTD